MGNAKWGTTPRPPTQSAAKFDSPKKLKKALKLATRIKELQELDALYQEKVFEINLLSGTKSEEMSEDI